MKVKYRVDKVPDGFIAYCPSMKPVSIFAKTEKEIELKLIDAIELYLKMHPEIFVESQTPEMTITIPA